MTTYSTTQLFKDRGIDPLFPSLVFKSELIDKTLCKKLEKTITKMWKKNDGPMNEKEIFVTYDNMNENKDFQELCSIVLEESADILDTLKIVRDSHYISAMWGNVSTGNHIHHKHIHPNSLLSGVFYVKTPEDCGLLAFSDPRPAFEMLQPDYSEYNLYNSGKVTMQPKEGQLIFFNSALPHAVQRSENPTNRKQVRISVPFNIMIKGKCTQYGIKGTF
jgi:uncharacterized protein (TIGR02466 family)